ncbi:MAG: NADH-quinone oxidoreductase subunit J [Chloroflexi bacterium]|nr:NADH-quinone oxidoreductase subunit J [Chloroflexota bacterium]
MTGLGTTDPFTTFAGSVAFWVAAVTSIVAAYMMVFTIRNLVRAALALTSVLAAVAVLYALLGADFLAVAQLVVYVGAIMVLIMFAIFLTPGQVDVPGLVGAAQHAGALIVSAAVLIVSVIVILTTNWNIRPEPLNLSSTADALGGLLLTRYVVPFEIASLLLTVALIGALVIARED